MALLGVVLENMRQRDGAVGCCIGKYEAERGGCCERGLKI